LAPFAVAVLLGGTLVPAHDASANDGFVDGPAPFPVRGGGVKGDGVAPDPEPTGRLIVRYRDGVTEAGRQSARVANGLALASTLPLPNTEVVVPGRAGTVRAMSMLARQPDVLWVEPEYRRTSAADPDPSAEPKFPQQWALNNTGQNVLTFNGAPDVDLNVPEAWEITTGDSNLVVAVIDDGVDISHPDLTARRWVNPGEIAGNHIDDEGNGFIDDVNGWDFCNVDNTVHDDDTAAHGTHVAGSIAASANGIGIAGVAPSVKIMAVKFLPDDPEAAPTGDCGTDSGAAKAIAYAYENGARIINASWGGYGDSQALSDAIGAAPDALFVAAAGNDNVDNDVTPFYPASFALPNVLSVAAIHNEGHLTSFTNYGAATVDLSAPGEDILSTVPGDFWAYASGTSMAAPHASGVAALAASANPGLLGDAPALRQHLIATAKALPSTLNWVATPRLLDARAAVVDRPDIRRLFGSNRFATAAAISAATYVPGVPYVVIAVGSGFPDALAGGAIAAQTGSPLLLVNQSSIPPETQAELQRLRPFRIYVLGGTGVVGPAVFSALQSYDEGGGAVRFSGSDRFGTAAAASAGFGTNVPTAFIANGLNFPDALAAVPASAVFGGPLLLATRTSIPPATVAALQDLDPGRIIVLGGTSMISAAVATKLGDYTAGPVTRWFGPDRYATAASVAVNAFPVSETAFVTNGLGFPDALAGGPSGGAYGGPLLLLSPTSVPAATRLRLQALQPARIFVLGGTSVVSGSVVTQIDTIFP
jgi:subtilisin family serine protease